MAAEVTQRCVGEQVDLSGRGKWPPLQEVTAQMWRYQERTDQRRPGNRILACLYAICQVRFVKKTEGGCFLF